MKASKMLFCSFLLAAGTILFAPVKAQEKKEINVEELAKELANPIANLMHVPFQGNLDYDIGKAHGTKYATNVQPVIPFSLNSDLNLITRYIIPIVNLQDVTSEGEKQSGLGDATISAFFSPVQTKNGLTWGAGPVFLVPIGTDAALSSRKWAVGPTAVVSKEIFGFTWGLLANQLWSFAGSNDRSNVSQMYLEPFIAKSWKSGAGVSLGSEMTFDWVNNKSTTWLIPTVSSVTKIGGQAIQLILGPRIPLSRQDKFGVRGTLVFVFPK